ncbi:MAG: YifB family Mg chelatase-like AAA ATPase [Lentisphaerota bacterium]
MLSTVISGAVSGIDAYRVTIEVNATGSGKESFVNIVGLPDNAVRESKDRVHSAIESSGLPYPYGKTIVNLAPADVKKEGASFDLPIALGMLHANNALKGDKVKKGLILGELALDGSIRSVKGVLSISMMASASKDIEFMIVPLGNAEEAAIASGKVAVYGISHLRDAYDFLSGKKDIIATKVDHALYFNTDIYPENFPDFSEVKGQFYVKRALEIAAAGGHNVLMIGSPGSGKSMLAKRLPGILPPLHLNEALEVTKTHSIVGLLPENTPILKNRPFRSPHHTISDAGLIGGNSTPSPGEISLAHHGVLFLDEFPEYKRNVLEVLRQPIENGNVTISRASGSCTFPAKFMLVAAMNPCPCGHFGDTQRMCRCSTHNVMRYRNKISGPLLDRIDIHIEVAPLKDNELLNSPNGESSSEIRKRVTEARNIQFNRLEKRNKYSNSQMEGAEIQLFCKIDSETSNYLKQSVNKLQLSARAFDKILKVARTIADLEKKENIELQHVCEAVQYRALDKRLW